LLKIAAVGVDSPRKLQKFHFLFEIYTLLFSIPPHKKKHVLFAYGSQADDVGSGLLIGAYELALLYVAYSGCICPYK